MGKLPVPFLPFVFSTFFTLIIPSASGLSFNFTSFIFGDQNISYAPDAYPADGAVQLTKNLRDANMTSSSGRATYYKPMQLWDEASGNLTDFTTHFSFSINSQNKTQYADGLTFFLVPEGSKLPSNISRGAGLGLARSDQPLNKTANQFVAVEFDIFKNDFDPPGEHVGIDINSMQSVNNITWLCDIREGRKTDAWISYNSSTQNLSVAFTGYRNDTVEMQFLSQIVSLRDYLPERVSFGFSASTGTESAIHTLYSWDFSSSLEIDATNPIDPAAASPPNGGSRRNRKKNRTGLAVGLGVGGGAIVVGAALVGFVIKFMCGHEEDEEGGHVLEEYMDDEFERGTGPKKFSYQELARATSNFKDEEKLGEGGFGGVYKGFLKEIDSFVAVKRVSRGSKQGVKEYAAEVKIISRLRHRNLVQLIGWCHERRELLLVYEFMPHGSLDSHLFKETSLLTWEVRYKIVQGLASGLLYLHEEWEQCVVHRDIKSSNIMLDSEFNAKLGDFGLARLVDHGKGSQTTVLAGTMGYMAPECAMTGKASRESDVYSFGIVALEIACGRKPINPKASNEDQGSMVKWVWGLYGEGKLLEAVDPRLCGDFNKTQMERLMIVGLSCAHPDEHRRPSIRQALHVLNFDAPLPILPSKMPVPSYFAPPMSASSLSIMSYGLTDSEGGMNNSSSYSYNTNSSQFTTSSSASSASAMLLHEG
ncbi:L-type lectin-domain containing receptor kinase IX.1-like [Populus alba x Populus x berolinensis]|uniref:L-type lectin-domain containing receptor kinase IX.1-like n=1 Tax=Populus alba x Populus x berolinensis TaxID=444605 RepID=A0AAD6RR66_9ROSI|nr:L-type lectin-domain containing receptor kinase IX.1-like [Populus alba x Populus x berolinensis]